MKICKDCGKLKPLNEYHKDKSRKDGHKNICKECVKEKQRIYREKNREHIITYQKSWNIKNKEHRAKISKQYYSDNKEQIRIKSIVYRNKIKTRKRSWASNTLLQHKNKGMKILVSTDYVENLAINITHCPICGCKIKWEYGLGHNDNDPSLDRINNELILTEDNVWIICKQCNATKLNRTMDEFVEYCKNVVEKYDY